MDSTQVPIPQPKCVASINAPLTAGASETDISRSLEPLEFKSAQWTPDGTSVIASDTDNNLRTYIVPPDILEKPELWTLSPYVSFHAPEPIYAFAPYPGFNLQDTSTTLVLSSIRDLPLRLTNTLIDCPVAVQSYRLVNELTEAWICPHSLAFTRSGSHFLAGSDSLISVFDVLRKKPEQQQKTIPSKHSNLKGGGVGVRGIVSTLNISNDGVLAYGTYSRKVGLYSDEGRGKAITFFSVAHDKDRLAAEDIQDIAGYGVTQVQWSPCATYLYVAERKSDVVQIYDIRNSKRLLGWCKGRNADTNQRLDIQIVECADGHEVLAGGMDGVARLWRNPHQSAGAVNPSFEWKVHDGPVTSTLLHSTGLLVMSCSSENKNPAAAIDDSSGDEEEGEEEDSDSDSDTESDDAHESSSSNDSSASIRVQGGMKLWSF